LENVPNIMLGVAGLGVATAIGFVGYALYYWLDSVPAISDLWDETKEAITKGPTMVKTAVTGLVDSRLASLTWEEFQDLKIKDDAEFEVAIAGIQEMANKYLSSSFPMTQMMGRRLNSKIPEMRENQIKKWDDLTDRWHIAHETNAGQ